MRSRLPTLLALGCLLSSTGLHGADAWTKLKVGMTRHESVAVLGPAVVMNSGRGFLIACYDGAAEVVFLGERVIAWTAPAQSASKPPPDEAWHFNQVRLPRGTRRIMTSPPTPAVREVPRERFVLPWQRMW